MSEQETNEILSPSEIESAVIETESKQRVSRGTLVLGGLILAAVGGLALMHLRAGPAKAEGATDATKTINSFFGDGQKNMATMQAVLKDTDKIVEQFRNFPAAAQVPLEDLQKNPFSDSKSDAKPAVANESADRQAKLTEALKRAGALKLQSILYSDTTRSCMINNQFHSEGETVDGFQIERIAPASVIVKSNGFRFELKAKN